MLVQLGPIGKRHEGTTGANAQLLSRSVKPGRISLGLAYLVSFIDTYLRSVVDFWLTYSQCHFTVSCQA